MYKDTELKDVVDGRVEPHIYAFETGTVPNYLKIGDTYRPVYKRLEEWRRIYGNLESRFNKSAVIEDKYFRDYSVHQFLEDEKQRRRIHPEDFPAGVYHSNEFFRDATYADVEEAIEDITKSYKDNTGNYTYYSMENIPLRESNDRPQRETSETKLRKLQQDVVNRFKEAINNKHTNLLMYAVMRFGKSITAMSCAKEVPDCKLVVIVSAKADVKSGWCDTICRIKNFEGFVYADSDDFSANPHFIAQNLANGKKVAACLTLQDISTFNIKERYKDLFNNHVIDLLIIDETHFGARAEKFGKVLQFNSEEKNDSQEYDDDNETFEKLEKTVHGLNSRFKLHLSGTPYRILMGSEFSNEEIICKCTYPDLIDASKKWDEEYLEKPKSVEGNEDEFFEEWDNPYFGFPQMIRFAFNFNESSLKKLEQLKKEGKEYMFDALFDTYKEKGKHKFVYEQEVVDFLSAINSGDNDGNILSFLDNKYIKKGQLCHHIVMVLPRRAACDAMANIIKTHTELKPLSNYVVIKATSTGSCLKPEQIKVRIRKCEDKGEKTITLTVGKMLTGTTVPEWDTMFFLRGCSSPQEYDQAVYRLQNPFVKEYSGSDGKIIRYNMKPQTLLVDFCIDRIFKLQEHRAFVNNILHDRQGNNVLSEQIDRELEISPILCMNAHKLLQVEPTDIIDHIRKYSQNRSIKDEALEIGVDELLKNDPDIYSEIMRYAALDGKNNIMTKAHNSETESNAEMPDEEENGENRPTQNSVSNNEDNKDNDNYEKRMQTYYTHILFFAYLTPDHIQTLSDICLKSETTDNKRILKNLDLNPIILKKLTQYLNPNIRRMLEFKIANINELSHDSNLNPTEKVERAMKQFGKWSVSEVVTPSNTADDMMALIPEDKVDGQFKFLDIASKEGEFANAIFKRFGEKVKKNIYSLPTSGVAYEFTRKVYTELELPIENIISNFNTYDLLDKDNDHYKDYLKNMNINAVVGNPPYNNAHSKEKKTVNRAFSSALYPHFIDFAEEITDSYISMITPSRWMTKTGQGISDTWVDEKLKCNHFVCIHDFYNALDCFGNSIELKGGVNYFLYDKNHNAECEYIFTQNGKQYISIEALDSKGAGIVIRDSHAASILDKIIEKEGNYYLGDNFSKLVSPQHFYDKDGLLTTSWEGYAKEKDTDHTIKYFISKQKNSAGFGWVKGSDVHKNLDTKNLNKVFISKAYNGGDSYPHQIIGKPIFGGKNCVCSQTYLVIGYDKENPLTPEECKNIISYIHTRFFRYMVYIKKKTQDNPSSVFQFVPLQDFSTKWTDEMLYSKYGIDSEEQEYIKSIIKEM